MQNLNKLTLEIKDPQLKLKYFDILAKRLLLCLVCTTIFKVIRVLYMTIVVSIYPFIEDKVESDLYIT